MKRSFYPRLAIDGMRKNRRMYGPYLAMGVLMAAICYILSALSRSDALRTLPGGDNLCMIMALGNVVLLIFSVIFLFYTNSFLIRRRRREFGLYNVLGMSKRNLARILTWETLLTAAIAIAGGLFFGVLLSKLIELAIVKMMGGTATLAFPFDLSALLGTAGGFAVIYALLWLVSVVRVGRSTAVALLRSEAAGEKPPRANWFLSLLGLILLGATENEPVFSEWNGQRPKRLLPLRVSVTYWPTTSSIGLRSTSASRNGCGNGMAADLLSGL